MAYLKIMLIILGMVLSIFGQAAKVEGIKDSVVVITGSFRGLGLHLGKDFLKTDLLSSTESVFNYFFWLWR